MCQKQRDCLDILSVYLDLLIFICMNNINERIVFDRKCI